MIKELVYWPWLLELWAEAVKLALDRRQIHRAHVVVIVFLIRLFVDTSGLRLRGAIATGRVLNKAGEFFFSSLGDMLEN